MRHGTRLFRSDQHGTAAVEMALMLPLLITLLFGGLEGAHYLYVEHQVVKGVRDGARYAGRLPFADVSCGTVSASAETAIKEVTRTGQTSGGTSRVRGWTNAQVTVTPACVTAIQTGIYKTMTGAPRITVSATVPYTSLFRSVTGIDVNAKVHASQQAAAMGV